MRTRSLLVVVFALIGACKSGPTTPTPPVVEPPPVVVVPNPPTVACPSPITRSTTGAGVTITYDTPAAEGGQSPVTVACEPASGGTFAIGTADVRCTATDALNRTATCAFPVTISRIPLLSRTRFMAFGDSLTVGTTTTVNPSAPPPYLFEDLTTGSYPAVLTQLLSARFTSQTITVRNEGKGGEKAVDGVGRAQSVINANRPEVVLIMTGYNDLSTLGEDGIDPAIAAITDIAKDARFRGARVFMATLSPPPFAANRGIANLTIVRFNEKLRSAARGETAVLVDVYAALAPDPNRYNSADGRHLNAEGYRKVAETFMAAIQADLEVR
jgi:lysophospholipase L1-like esterase